MQAFIDLSDPGHEEPVPTHVLAILFLNEDSCSEGFFFYGRTTVVVGCCARGGVTTVVDAGSRLTVSV